MSHISQLSALAIKVCILNTHQLAVYQVHIMALKIVLLALLLLLCWSSEAQSQGDGTSLPLSYNATELQRDGATCPNDQLRQETVQSITSDIRNLLQNSVLPLLDIRAPLTSCPCLSGGGTRVANLNMTDPSQQCPQGWTLIPSPRRTCGRTRTGTDTCDSATFSAQGITYSRVCGRVKAYQIGVPDAFWGFNQEGQTTVDSDYISGVSITHGSSPRQHVWSFAAAAYEQWTGSVPVICSCTNINNPNIANFGSPPFVGDDYFCETGATTSPSGSQFLSDDPLWDGEGCGPTSTCCELNNPPWFCKQLPTPTSDDIEVRLCFDESIANENVAVEELEILIS